MSEEFIIQTTQDDQKFPIRKGAERNRTQRDIVLHKQSRIVHDDPTVWIDGGKKFIINDLDPEALEIAFNKALNVATKAASAKERFSIKEQHFNQIVSNIMTAAMDKGVNVADWMKNR